MSQQQILTAYGDSILRTTGTPFKNSTDSSVNSLIVPAFIQVDQASEITKEIAKYQTGGKIQNWQTKITETAATVSMNFQVTNLAHLSLFEGTEWKTETGVTRAVIKSNITVPAGGVIADADITAANAGTVLAFLEETSTGGWSGLLKPADASGSIGANEFFADGSAGTLSLETPALDGAKITYVVDKAYSSVEALNHSKDNPQFGNLEFIGTIPFTDDESIELIVHSLARASDPSYSFGTGLVEVTMEFDALVPPDKPKAYEMRRVGSYVV